VTALVAARILNGEGGTSASPAWLVVGDGRPYVVALVAPDAAECARRPGAMAEGSDPEHHAGRCQGDRHDGRAAAEAFDDVREVEHRGLIGRCRLGVQPDNGLKIGRLKIAEVPSDTHGASPGIADMIPRACSKRYRFTPVRAGPAVAGTCVILRRSCSRGPRD